MKDGKLLSIVFRFEHTTYTMTGKQAEGFKYALPHEGIWGRNVKKVFEENKRERI